MHKTIVVFLTTFYTISGVMGDFKLLVVHNNDMHSRFEETSATSNTCLKPEKCYGGFARISQTVKDIRQRQADKRNVLFLNAGDTFQGTSYYTIFKWNVVADMIDLLGIDVMSLGNHEFDDSPNELGLYLNSIKTVTVAANIDYSKEPEMNAPTLKSYKVLDLNGTKIAVIGYLTPNTTYLSNTRNVSISDEVESINNYIQQLKQQNINIFIALGHSGYNIDLEIARRVPDIDLVVGGHTNTFLYNGDPPDMEHPDDIYPKIVVQESKRKVPVVQAYAFTKYLGYLELDFDDQGELESYSGNPILLDNTFPEDPNVLNKLSPWKTKLNDKINEVVGRTKVVLDSHNKVCKLQECNIGNLITDANVAANVELYNGKEGWTDASICIEQAGGIRGSINATIKGGNVTYGDILTVTPFDSQLCKGKIKGNYLREILEFSVHRYEKTAIEQIGEFLQVSGIHVVYDLSQPSGSRVKSVKVKCALCDVPNFYDLNDTMEYGLLANQFIMTGGDNYLLLRDHVYDVVTLNVSTAGVLRDYIRKRSPVYPEITSRITILNAEVPTPIPPTEGPKGAAAPKEHFLTLFIVPVLFCISNYINYI